MQKNCRSIFRNAFENVNLVKAANRAYNRRWIKRQRSNLHRAQPTYVLVVAGHHVAVGHLVADAVPGLARIKRPVRIGRIGRIHPEQIRRRRGNSGGEI
jgi:hypothetical protein